MAIIGVQIDDELLVAKPRRFITRSPAAEPRIAAIRDMAPAPTARIPLGINAGVRFFSREWKTIGFEARYDWRAAAQYTNAPGPILFQFYNMNAYDSEFAPTKTFTDELGFGNPTLAAFTATAIPHGVELHGSAGYYDYNWGAAIRRGPDDPDGLVIANIINIQSLQHDKSFHWIDSPLPPGTYDYYVTIFGSQHQISTPSETLHVTVS